MARRWTPQRFATLRRVRVTLCAVVVAVACVLGFSVSCRKTVALEVNGESREVSTYALSVDRLLEEQGIDVKTHDLVQSTSGDMLADHAVVTVQSAYQAFITIDGDEVPFWTVATSADQLLGFFEQNNVEATKVTVNIDNVYNKLTGGLIINEDGPVQVIADGQTREAPNGKLPAASILDSLGIQIGKDDRVSVEKDGGTTILRVQRVTYGETTKTVTIPFDTYTVVDSNLEPGQTVVRQEGENGEKTERYNTTFVDGQPESSTLIDETTTKIAIDRIIAVGPERTEEPQQDSSDGNDDATTDDKPGASSDGDTDDKNDKNDTADSDNGNDTAGNDGAANDSGSSESSEGNGTQTDTQPGTPTQQPSTGNSGSSGGSGSADNAGNSGNSGNQQSGNSGSSGSGSTGTSGESTHSGLWHPTVSQAQTYAAGAAAQRGWTGAEWDALVWIWNRESGWKWDAENASGAYGIPQAMPGSKMGTGWRDDGAVQINWGLAYIAQRYGTPTGAKQYWLSHGWY